MHCPAFFTFDTVRPGGRDASRLLGFCNSRAYPRRTSSGNVVRGLEMYLRITKYYYFCSQSRLPVFSGTKHGSPGPSGCGYPRYLQNGPEYQHPMSRWVRIARHLQFAGSPEKNFEWKCCSGTENLFKH